MKCIRGRTFIELLQECLWRTPLRLQQRTEDMVVLLPVVDRFLIFLPAPKGKAVNESHVGYVTVLLEFAPNALPEIRHRDVERIDTDDFGGL